MAGWGAGAWGTSSWAIGAPGTLFIERAVATSDRSLKVYLSIAPLRSSTIIAGSALDPTTWTVTQLASGEVFTVLGVQQVAPLVFELLLLEKLSSVSILHRVESQTLVTASGMLISAPKSADFPGASAEKLAATKAGLVDIDNPPFDDGQVAGTIAVNAGGDYITHSGVPFLKKLIMRRLSTYPGSFFHLTEYGLGIRLKEPLTIPDLTKLRKEVERQILREPEFASVRAQITLNPNGVLTIRVSAILSTDNTEITIPLEVPTQLVSL